MQCPRCESRDVERLPGNFITHDTGFQCRGCQRKLRSPGNLLMNLFVLVLGLGFLGLMTFLLIQWDWTGPRQPTKPILIGAAGAVVAGYAVVQLARPTPRVTTDDMEARSE